MTIWTRLQLNVSKHCEGRTSGRKLVGIERKRQKTCGRAANLHDQRDEDQDEAAHAPGADGVAEAED
jgi:hypothetical protein